MSGKDAAHLPPKPDSYSGEPRPPRAPTYGKSDARDHSSKAPTPKPPEGCGPTLEAYVVSNASAWSGGIFVIVLFVVALTIYDGFSWAGVWWIWLIILGSAALIVFMIRGTFCAAGADWLRTRQGWVNTYELEKIELHLYGSAVELVLKDSSGRGFSEKIENLQANHELWDLVYNGMKHSIANGAHVNSYASGALKLGGTS